MSDEDAPDGEKQVNGHKPKGLMPLDFAAALSSGSGLGEDYDFDVDSVLAGVVQLHADIAAADRASVRPCGSRRPPSRWCR